MDFIRPKNTLPQNIYDVLENKSTNANHEENDHVSQLLIHHTVNLVELNFLGLWRW